MGKKEVVGKWVDEMNNPKKAKRERKTVQSFVLKKIRKLIVFLEKKFEHNILILIVSSIIAIPVFIFFVIAIENITKNVTNISQLRSILQVCGLLLVIPYLLLLFYVQYYVSKGSIPILKILFVILIIAFGFLNILMGIKILDFVNIKKEINDNFIFAIFFLDSYTISFLITKVSYIIYLKIMNKIKRLANWVIDNNQENDDILKAKLSFINKVITGFLAIVASILGLILTLNKIL